MKTKEYKAVDTTNDDQMVNEGLRYPKLKIDRSIKDKTDSERDLVKKLKSEHKKFGNTLVLN